MSDQDHAQTLREMLQREMATVNSHREMAESDRTGTEADHEEGRLLAERMSGREYPRRSLEERARAAVIHDRVADAHEARGNALAAAIAALSAAALARTCATCRHWRASADDAMCTDESEANPMSWQWAPAHFGCTLYQPQENK